MPIWLGTAIGVLIGLVSGVSLIAVALNNGLSDWARPEVVGPALGAFLAAMIGVGGAVWSHEARKQERQERAERESKEAITKLFVTTVEMYLLFYLRLKELRRAETERNIRPGLILPVGKMLLSAVNDVRHAATSQTLPAGIATVCLVMTRDMLESADAIEFKEEHLQSPNPNYAFELDESEHTFVQNLVQVFGAKDNQIRKILGTLHDAAGLEGNADDIDAMIEEVLEQNKDKLLPGFQF